MIVLVVGMHRSGTSAVAGVLHQNGIIMGREKDFFPPPMFENPKGFYENICFRRINDVLLSYIGYSVKSWQPDIPKVKKIPNEFTKEMIRVLINYEKDFPWWGWKDPRTMLTFLYWYEAARRVGLHKKLLVVMMKRDKKKIAQSMVYRGNKQGYAGQFVQVAEQYYTYFDNCYNAVATEYEVPLFTINFPSLIEKPALVAADLTVFLGKTIDKTGFIDRRIPQNL